MVKLVVQSGRAELRHRLRGREAATLARLVRRGALYFDGQTLQRRRWEERGEVEGWMVLEVDLPGGEWKAWDASWRPSWAELGQVVEVIVALAVQGELPPHACPALVLFDGRRALCPNAPMAEHLGRFLVEDGRSSGDRSWKRWFARLVLEALSREVDPAVAEEGLAWELRLSRVDQDLAHLVRRGLSESGSGEWGEWRRLFLEHPQQPPVKPLSPKEIETLRARRDLGRTWVAWQSGVREFLHQHRRILLPMAIGAAFLAFLWLPGLCSPSPRSAIPWESDEDVVFSYYEALNRLHEASIRRLSRSAQARQDGEGVAHLFVFRAVRESTLGDSGLIPLDEWRRQGEPRLPQGLTVHGVDLVLVQRLEEGLFEITYHRARWDLDPVDGRPVIEKVVDLVRVDRTAEGPPLEFLKREVRPWP